MKVLFLTKQIGAKNTPNKKVSIKDVTAIVNIPSNLEIRGLIRESPIPVKHCSENLNQQADKVAYLISQIIDRQALKKQSQLGVEYVRMNSKIMQETIRDYDIYLNWMVKNGILDWDPIYILGGHSRGYKLGLKYQQKGIQNHVITYPVLVNKLGKGNIDAHSKQKYPKLLHDLKSLTIENYKGVIEETNIGKYKQLAYKISESEINEEIKIKVKKSVYIGMNKKQLKNAIHKRAIDKISSWQNALCKINEKQFYFNQDKTSSRLHTSAVSIKKELRKHLMINGQRLVACDIKNSQPYFSTGLFLNPKKFENIILDSIHHYKGTNLDWVYEAVTNMLVKFETRIFLDSTRNYIDFVASGELYEFMAKELSVLTNKKWSREAAKLELFKVLFSPPRYKNILGRKIMKKHFPEVLRFFTLINYGFRKTKAQTSNLKNYRGNRLSRILQIMESETVLDVICKELEKSYPNIPLITIHDGIATSIGNQYIVKSIMERILEEEVGIAGNVEIEWDKWGIGRYPAY
ncbi:MAG: hypothetical protein IPM48_10700 [Saprospiraceae bacterium]|nr:hypothetical protein [Saprospiraceae bacterium]